MKSPFKFLDPYQPEDREAFFGRDAETKELYNLVTKNRLTFVYGPSGTGKTSLVQCGLSNRFGGVDWLPIFVRRGDDINAALRRETGKALGEGAAFDGELPAAVGALFNRYLRPVYLIFDQFEELFILGDPAEQQTFYDTIAELLEADLPCRILFILREDYFGHLNQFEKTVPELYHRKLRVEPMNRDSLRTVITGSCKVFDIGLDDARRSPELILDNILAEKTGVHMPYVQVYLYMLYQEAAKTGQSPLRFSDAVIRKVGPITDVLGRFLQEQKDVIFKALQQNPAFASIPDDAVPQVLDVFVSAEGTKAPVGYTPAPDGGVALSGKAAHALAVLPPALVSAAVLELEKSRILRRSDDAFELAHDTLAALIDQQRSAEQRQLRDIRQRIETGYREHVESLKSDKAYYFDKGQLARIEPFLPKLALEPVQADFLDQSRVEAGRVENAEKERVARELNRQRFFTRLVAGVAVLAIGASVFAFFKQKQATEASSLAETRRLESEGNLRLATQNEQTANKAKAEAEQNLHLAKANELQAKQNLDLAMENEAKAKREEEKAKKALVAVQKQKEATEEQRRKAVESAGIAEEKTKEAQSAREAAEGNLKKFEAASAEIVDALVREADNLIYRLDYAGAAAKLRTAADLDQPTASFKKALAEVAFFWNESGLTTQATDLLAAAKQTDAPNEKAGLQSWLKNYAGPWHDSLMLRYYPNMLPVAGGEANIDHKKAPVSAFKIARTETTMWQYALFYTSQGKDIRANKDLSSLSWGINGDNPMVYVSWFDAALYANWLSRRFGLQEAYNMDAVSKGNYGDYYKNIALDSSANGYRLPTEVEWEYAASGGAAQEDFEYAGGNEIDSVGWYSGNSGNRTHPVATKQANNLGLYDMSGNVWEWCSDWYGGYPATFPANYRGVETASFRVIRGGSWYFSAEYCRAANRDGNNPGSRGRDIGFRLVFVP